MCSKYEKGIKQEEIDFPKQFASYEEKEYGILFYMADNKDSYDGNHACIYPDKITDLGAVPDDIAAFYKKLGIRAAFFHPFEAAYAALSKDQEAIYASIKIAAANNHSGESFLIIKPFRQNRKAPFSP